VLSLCALAIGPALAAVLGRTSRAAELIDGLVLVALSGLVLFHILPHTIAAAGWLALAGAAGGFALPFLVERVGRRSGSAAHVVLAPLVMAAFGVHAFADGAVLVGRGADEILGVAIIL